MSVEDAKFIVVLVFPFSCSWEFLEKILNIASGSPALGMVYFRRHEEIIWLLKVTKRRCCNNHHLTPLMIPS